MVNIDENVIWSIIETYFKNNPQSFVKHHIDSYNDFFHKGLPLIFEEMNPLIIELDYDDDSQTNRSKCKLFFGGKNAKYIMENQLYTKKARRNTYFQTSVDLEI
jgi:DNA-directed RNA polymerase beta subunit